MLEVSSPTLSDLPAPPPGRGGWPWTQAPPALPPAMPDGAPWPRISIVTPSYEQVEFLEETLRSVLLQGYPNLEYLVMDGGSTDGSAEILHRYSRWITHWESVPDRGQTHAINKGLARSTGEIFAYVNSDDLFMPGALGAVARGFAADRRVDALYGRCVYIDPQGRELFVRQARFEGFRDYLPIWRHFEACTFLTQPEVFLRTQVLHEVGGFREQLRSAMDLEMWLRLLHAGYRFGALDASLAKFRLYPEQKSAGDRSEVVSLIYEYADRAAEELPRRERRRLLAELDLVCTSWQVNGGETQRPMAVLGACLSSVRHDWRVLATRRFWGALARPLRQRLSAADGVGNGSGA